MAAAMHHHWRRHGGDGGTQRQQRLVKLYRRATAAKALVATILFLFVFKALFYTHGRLLLLESFSIERSGSCLFGYYVLLLAYNALWCQPS